MFPVFSPVCAFLANNSIANGCLNRHDVTYKNVYAGRVYLSQELLSRVKILKYVEEKLVRCREFWLYK